ncbi:class I SAM-dependent methyltransferase [Streptomyces sp. B1866]|uniref:class I SAM-dependent methyltransferase n=1 Tax=Streptomyces sp. B1866 TaxID=3075431 RepID=UPI00288CC7E9|nr:class I SAM-dependent methyltransferase [Streptomyces sp. B1866]MDT3396707.1 class I SAM-dependent methyltransferase [Streptomyces sp. B1866]
MNERVNARLHATVHRHGGDFDQRRSRSYDRLARRTLRGLYRRVADDVAAVAPRAGVVLDVGTGPGRLLHEVAARRDDLVLEGVDVSADMIAVARQAATERGLSGRLALQTADVAALPYGVGGVDLVVTTLSMHHWPAVDAAAAELARVLRPGGSLLVYDFRFAPLTQALAALGRQPAFASTRTSRTPVRTPWSPVAVFTRLALTASDPSDPREG